MILAYTLLALWFFWLLYLAIMSLYRAHQAGTMPVASKVLGYPTLLVGVIVDASMNITVFSVVFFEAPKQWLVTQRLQSHVGQDTWRGRLARFICHNLLSPFDPSGDHCD